MKIIVSESQYNKIIQSVQEQETKLVKALNFLLPDVEDNTSGTDKTDETESSTNSYDETSSESVVVEPGSYYVNPRYNEVTIDYGGFAVKLNKDAEILLKSIAIEAGMKKIFVSSSLRTHLDQARVNKQNNRGQIKKWYCRRGESKESCDKLLSNWDKLKSGTMSIEDYAAFLKERDRELGRPISNHIPGYAMDIVPYSQALINTANTIKSKGNSGIRSVFPEPDNNCVHLEFEFQITGQSGVKTPEIRKKESKSGSKGDVVDKKTMVIDTRNPGSNEYALIYGGYPSSRYGAQFMYNQGKDVSKLANKNIFYSDKESPITSVEVELRKINPNAKITSVSGFSGGGPKTIEAMNSGKYKFIGLIDPYIRNPLSSLPSNTKMISNHGVWSTNTYPEAHSSLRKMEKSGVSEFINTNHLSMPKVFFEKYGDLV